MSKCDATVFNLSMLTSDAWGALWSVVLFHHSLSWAYFVSLAVVVTGVVIYNTAGYSTPQAPSPPLGPSDAPRHVRLPSSEPVCNDTDNGDVDTNRVLLCM